MPFALQPSAPNNSLPSQAFGTTGFEPNQAATSPCTFGEMDHSSQRYAQLGCLAPVAIMVVSAQPVAPSAGTVVATFALLASSVLAWNGHEPDATTPSFWKSCTCTFASCQ